MKNLDDFDRYGIWPEIAPFAAQAIDVLAAQTKDDKYKKITYEYEEQAHVLIAPRSRIYKPYIQAIQEKAYELLQNSKGLYRATVSIAVDGRVDVSIWANKDMSNQELEDRARQEFMDADLSKMDVIGSKPVYAYIKGQDYDRDLC